jgi:hypothetical protein
MKRFDLFASTHDDAVRYILNRALQIAHAGAALKAVVPFEEGVWAEFELNYETYHSLYLLDQHRGAGRFYELWRKKCDEKGHDVRMLTTAACQMAQYFRHKRIPFVLADGLTNTPEYLMIQVMYGDTRTKRTGVYYMNHIDEGLCILNKIDASLNAKLAYMLHPAFQSDAELEANCGKKIIKELSPQAIIASVEYRSVANEYLSTRTIKNIEEIRLSPLKDVNDMLVADKVQNRKDFELYHIDSHGRARELNTYFHNWLDRLSVRESFYQDMKGELVHLTSTDKFKA